MNVDDPRLEKILYSEEEVNRRVQELAGQINKDYAGKKVVIVGILKGAFLFMSELVKRLNIETELEFMALSSYQNRSTSSGTVRIVMDLRNDIEGKEVLIVEDIVDSGRTLKYLLELLRARKPASLKTAVLLRKSVNNVEGTPDPDYLAFDKCPNVFVVGMGLDYAEAMRSFPFIAQLKKSVYANE